MKKILQIDGGGVRGIVPLAALCDIETRTGKQCYQVFDLITGTSTGSIIGGMLACGVPAHVLYGLYVDEGTTLFKKNGFFNSLFGAKYDRSSILKKMNLMIKQFGKGPKLGEVKTGFLSTTFNGVTGRTHFQMSWDNYHKGLDLVQVISWSALSATHYFGPIAVPDYEYDMDYQIDVPYRTRGAVFRDGGQGRNNCTLNECITTCVLKDYIGHGEPCHILSLGTGAQRLYKPYDKCISASKLSELKSYVTEERSEGVYDQLHKAYALASHLPDLHVYRLDVVLSKDEDSLDALGSIPAFVNYGRQIVPKIPSIFLER